MLPDLTWQGSGDPYVLRIVCQKFVVVSTCAAPVFVLSRCPRGLSVGIVMCRVNDSDLHCVEADRKCRFEPVLRDECYVEASLTIPRVVRKMVS